MSHHNKEFPRQAELNQSLKDHGLNHKSPSQLADAFRFGWRAALALATPAPAQPERQAADVDEMAAWMRRLVRALRKAAPGNALAEKALDDLKRRGLLGDALRQAEEPDPLHVANERGEGELSGQSRKVISTDFSPKLRWCSYCGEGVTSFCRGKTPDCPMALAAPKEKP